MAKFLSQRFLLSTSISVLFTVYTFSTHLVHSYLEDGNQCATLYENPDLEGTNFNISNGWQFTNLAEDFVTINGIWNSTASLQVVPGCMLTACNESYFNGECNEIKANLTQLPVQFGNVLSLNCTCAQDCKCQDFYKMRTTECARAYVFEGGCNSCTPFYTVMNKGVTNMFSEDFSTKVKSLMVREGCELTVYDETHLGGEFELVNGIQPNWSTPIGSYECNCFNVVPTQPPPRNKNWPPLINIPSTAEEINALMNGQTGRHPALIAALQSMRNKRSPSKAYILLLGSTGSGKSSAINLLFDNNVTAVGGMISTTKDIIEFRIPITVNELGIGNCELRVIDTPGLGDTSGIEQDAKFLATLEEFLDSHEDLSTRLPNVVLIFHKFTDNRYAGEGSKYVQMLRGLDSFRERITDKKYSNVAFVFSHFASETKTVTKNPAHKIASLKTVIEDYSQFPKPTVLVMAENKPQEQDLPVLNGYYKLPNGDFYPRNLFDKIQQMTSGGGDTIGEAIIRTAFRDPDSFNISYTSMSTIDARNSKVSKYFDILAGGIYNVNQTAASKALATAAESMSQDLKLKFPDALLHLQKTLNLQNIPSAAQIPKTTMAIVRLFSELKKNDATLYLMDKAFDISPPPFPANILTGYGYNVFRDLPLSSSPFKLGDYENSPIGYKFPSIMTCVVKGEPKDVLHYFTSKELYVKERLNSLGIAGSLNSTAFEGDIKYGYNVEIPGANLTERELTAVREFRKFELILNDRPELNDDFKKAVRKLTPYNESSHQSFDEWKNFFSTYGTHVVKSAFGGGEIKISLITAKNASGEIGNMLRNFIQFAEDISIGHSGNSSLNVKIPGVKHRLNFNGGNEAFMLQT